MRKDTSTYSILQLQQCFLIMELLLGLGSLCLLLISLVVSGSMVSTAASSPHLVCDSGVCEQKHSFGEDHPLEDRLSEHQIRGWRAVFAGGLHDQGSRKRTFVLFTDTGRGQMANETARCRVISWLVALGSA